MVGRDHLHHLLLGSPLSAAPAGIVGQIQQLLETRRPAKSNRKNKKDKVTMPRLFYLLLK